MKIVKKIKDSISDKIDKAKKAEEYKKKIEELKKRDPFIYKNF